MTEYFFAFLAIGHMIATIQTVYEGHPLLPTASRASKPKAFEIWPWRPRDCHIDQIHVAHQLVHSNYGLTNEVSLRRFYMYGWKKNVSSTKELIATLWEPSFEYFSFSRILSS